VQKNLRPYGKAYRYTDTSKIIFDGRVREWGETEMRLKFCVSERRNTLRQNGGTVKEIKRLDCGTADDPSRNMEVLRRGLVLTWLKSY
jgi:hypothetical protein